MCFCCLEHDSLFIRLASGMWCASFCLVSFFFLIFVLLYGAFEVTKFKLT